MSRATARAEVDSRQVIIHADGNNVLISKARGTEGLYMINTTARKELVPGLEVKVDKMFSLEERDIHEIGLTLGPIKSHDLERLCNFYIDETAPDSKDEAQNRLREVARKFLQVQADKIPF